MVSYHNSRKKNYDDTLHPLIKPDFKNNFKTLKVIIFNYKQWEVQTTPEAIIENSRSYNHQNVVRAPKS